MAEASYFLDGVNRCGAICSDFVGRVDGVPLSTDKWATLDRLEPAHREAVSELGFAWSDLKRAEQVHGAEVAVVTGEAGSMVEGVDGLICSEPGVVLGIYVADCAAVYFVDRVSGAIGLVHSGRKGSELGIVEVTVKRMGEQFGTRAEDLEVAISPCIRPPHYEVDFAATIRAQLRECGVPEGALTDSGVCTGANVARYYSYRIEEGCTGRMLALLGRPGHEEVGA